MALTDVAVRNAKPGPKTIRLKDERGLHLEISPKGGKWWRLRYWISGKERLISLGTYPDTSLKDARERRDEARKLIANGIDPSQTRKEEKAGIAAVAVTFEKVAREWFSKFKENWTDSHADRTIRRFEMDVFPWIGERPIRDILAPELLTTIRRIEARGAIETAHRTMQNCGQVFRYAVASGHAERDISADLRGAIPPSKEKHHASVTDPKDVAALLRIIETYQGSFVTMSALRLAPMLFVRPGELRHAEWSEIDFDKAEWRIPAAKMKMREQHIVPLCRQAIAIMRELHPLTGAGRYLFPSVRTSARPMSENTVNAALRRLGYAKDEMTGHGFRSMASTLLNEMGWNRDAIERQLAHAERNSIRAAYNFAEFLPERRRMMQAWADYLEKLQAGAKVTPIHAAAGE
ncbi:integrase family protein [Solidesulfovibrio carbinoliphilus subsp. oakridgensis]|uniref:Integrase family protein n=1 Tax=Solidesulfovibrio carbinoliphilus subsp. oakridgensis TaxID=694327 RepID=G7Q5Y8_9BACT|nr:integrase arm-type DNA-binding domain-containing protein [Solidesulfovibrio carbinoliphilus]EHJ46925.1 integrase family protein [Solidesulfovibrio carbinoliphilus subsp. oakridgensis]